MKCSVCGGNRVYWRCDNKETNTTKYKCLDCETILTEQTKPTTPILTKTEQTELVKKIDDIKKESKRKGGKTASKRKKSKKLQEEKHLYKARNGKRIIYKQKNKKTQYYGVYKRKDAIKIRDKLIKCDWDMNQLEKIKKEVLG